MSDIITLRFPGTTEYRMSERSPEVGDVLERDGDNWVVEKVTEADDGSRVVALRPQLFVGPESNQRN